MCSSGNGYSQRNATWPCYNIFLLQAHYLEGLRRIKDGDWLNDTSMLLLMLAICKTAQSMGKRVWFLEPLLLGR